MTHLRSFLSVVGLFSSIAFASPSDYQIIASRQEAVDYLNRRYAQTGSTNTAIPSSDPRYDDLESAIRESVDTLREVFPEKMRDLPYPFAVSTRGLSIDAAVRADDVTKKPYWMILVTQGLLDRARSHREGVMGVMAHEIGHLLFRHDREDAAKEIEKFFYAPPGEEPLGMDQLNDPKAWMIGTYWRNWTRAFGSYPKAELGGLAYSGPYRTGAFQRVFDHILAKYGSDSAECTNAKALRAQWLKTINENYYQDFEQTFELTRAQAQTLVAAGSQLTQTSEACVGSKMIPLETLVAEFPADQAEILKLPLTRGDYAKFNRETNVVRALRVLVNAKHRTMRALYRAFEIDRIRVYTEEEQADDVTFEFFMKKGLNPMVTRRMSMQGNSGPAAWDACYQKIKSGQAPGYGVLIDTHHSTCYRAFRLVRLAESRGYRFPELKP